MSIFKKRKNSPIIEDKINALLSGDARNALDWAAFLWANGLKIEWNPRHNGWKFTYRNKLVGTVYVAGADYELIVNFCTRDFDGGGPADDDLKEFVWAHATVCPHGCGAATICERSQKNISIFGKEYENICITPLMIINPDVKDLGYAKKLVLMLKQNQT